MKLVALMLLQLSFLAGASALAAGATCTDTASCADGNLLCESSVCKIKVDATTCTGTSDTNCVANAQCTSVTAGGFKCSCTSNYADDGGFCRLATGGTCTSGQANQCKTTDVCEGTTCKIKVDATTCTGTSDTNCVSNAQCTVVAAGGFKCSCTGNYANNGSFCIVLAGKVGGSCTAGDDTTCTDTNSACTGTGSAAVCTCKAGFETKQSDLTCVVSTGADCSSPKSSLCKSTDVCENNFCRIRQTGSCVNNTLNCVAGATCVTSGSDSTCTCKTDLSTANAGSGKCDPKANKIGGTCTSASCEDTNAECPSGTCACKTNYTTSPATLTCGLNVGADCSSNTNLCITGSFCQSGKCKRAANQYCTGTGDAANCVSQSDCTNAKCTCQTGYTARDGLCSAAAGLFMSSLLTLLVVMTSRLISMTL